MKSSLSELIHSIACVLLFSLLQTATAQDFPDDYFYSGAERPAGLRGLEGKPAPDLSLDAWIGEETSLSDLRGQVVIVDFWATWCGPCMAAIPKNISLVEKYGDNGLAFVGVHDSRNGWDRASSVVNDKNINYPVARDAGGASVKAYNLSFWPTYVAIDRKGVVRAAGLLPTKLEDVVKVLLAEDGGFVVDSGLGKSEFPVEWYIGGANRLSGMAKLEGVKAPPLRGEKWIGEEIKTGDREGRVTVVRFMSPLSKATRDSIGRWQKTAAELRPQGVIFIGVCDHLADWDRMKSLLGEEEPPFPVACDFAPRADEGDALPLGVTATAYGIRMWPTTVVIDRAGRVRAAGLREEQLRPVIDKLMAEPLDTAR